jgi:hypothetical protein
MTSIARKINLSCVWHQFLDYLFLDIILAAVLAAIFVVVIDKQQTGIFSIEYIREFKYLGLYNGDLYDNLQNIIYSVEDWDGSFLYEINMGDWLAYY